MNNTYNYLLTKTKNIEESVDSLSTLADYVNNKKAISITKNFINLSTTSKRKIFLCKLEVEKNNSLIFQLNCVIKISAKQTLSVSLFANDVLISKTTRALEPGRHNLSLFKDHFHTYESKVNVYLEICSLNNKFLSLETSSLIVDGVKKDNSDYNYSIVEAGDNLFLSYSLNGDVFYKIANKSESVYDYDDFEFLTNAKSHQVVYDSNSSKLFIFRIDVNGNLFFGEVSANDETFIDNNVSNVSTTITNDGLAFCYLKNKSCFVCELKDNTFSSVKQVQQVKKPLDGCYLYFHNHLNKLFLILTDSQNNNYILESQSEKSRLTENLYANFLINVETYEVNDES